MKLRRTKNKQHLATIQTILEKYRLPFGLEDFVFGIFYENLRLIETVQTVVAIRILHYLQKVSELREGETMPPTRHYFDILQQYALLLDEIALRKMMDDMRELSETENEQYFIINELDGKISFSLKKKQEYEALLSDNHQQIMVELFAKVQTSLEVDGHVIIGYLKQEFKEILRTLQYSK